MATKKAAKKKAKKADPWRMYAPAQGVDLYRCNKCFHITHEDGYDVGGADPGNLFCNQCGHEGRPRHVGWMRESFLWPGDRDGPTEATASTSLEASDQRQ
jgi:hypothetical protein